MKVMEKKGLCQQRGTVYKSVRPEVVSREGTDVLVCCALFGGCGYDVLDSAFLVVYVTMRSAVNHRRFYRR